MKTKESIRWNLRKDAKGVTIAFGEWLSQNCYPLKGNENHWQLYAKTGRYNHTTEELFNLFLKNLETQK